jgi:hypothetical protein
MDGEREAPGKRSMQAAIGIGMNAAKQHRCINVRVQTVEKVVPDARLLPLVERVPFRKISFRRTS